MKVTNGVWVVKIAYDYSWATVYAKYADIEEAQRCDLNERNYRAFFVRWLHEGEDLPEVEVLH